MEIKDNFLPELYFGEVGKPGIDWRNLPDEPEPDEDDENSPTPEDVLLLLGFDPDELEKEEKGIFTILKGGPGSGNFGHAGRPGEVGGSSSEGTAHELSDLDKAIKLGASICLDKGYEHVTSKDGKKYEKAFFVTGRGAVVEVKGKKDRVTIPREEMEDSPYFLHTHPDECGFSGDDVGVFVSHPLLQTTDVITPSGKVYRLEKEGYWDDKRDLFCRTKAKEIVARANNFQKSMMPELARRHKNGEPIIKLAGEFFDRLTKLFAKEYHLKYSTFDGKSTAKGKTVSKLIEKLEPDKDYVEIDDSVIEEVKRQISEGNEKEED